jgi:hypothetical protein
MGNRKSEGRIEAKTVGNGRHPDPPEHKAARVGMNFRRET